MRRIEISDAVWEEIAKLGNFGETEDDVLRRVFSIEDAPVETALRSPVRRGRGNIRYATKRMSARPESGQLVVEFPEDGACKRWQLPDRQDKAAIRVVRKEAVEFALENGASNPGQKNAVLKALTDAGYYINK